MAVCTGEDTHRNDVDIFLQGSFSNLFRRLAQARIDDLEASITQRAGNDLCTAVMAVKARFCN